MTGAGAPPLPSRRRFLGGALVLLCAAPVFGAGCGDAALPVEPTRPRRIGPWEIPAGTVLSPARYAVLAALMDALIPGDDGSPGATLAHAAYYLDQLLGAFGSDPPRIFAGGPTSGRHGGLDEFSHFQPLTRVEEIRWRTYLEGSRGIAEREFNGPVTGLAERYEQGLDAVDALAESSSGAGFAMMPLGSRRAALSHVDAAFLELVYEHAVEGTYGDPVYGGNFEEAGWRAIDYEGDRQPIGFSANEMAHPEEG